MKRNVFALSLILFIIFIYAIYCFYSKSGNQLPAGALLIMNVR